MESNRERACVDVRVRNLGCMLMPVRMRMHKHLRLRFRRMHFKPHTSSSSPPLTRACALPQVYLQVAQTGEAQDWNARFSGMMFKVLQDSYVGSGLAKESATRIEQLAGMSPDTSGWSPVGSLGPCHDSGGSVCGQARSPPCILALICACSCVEGQQWEEAGMNAICVVCWQAGVCVCVCVLVACCACLRVRLRIWLQTCLNTCTGFVLMPEHVCAAPLAGLEASVRPHAAPGRPGAPMRELHIMMLLHSFAWFQISCEAQGRALQYKLPVRTGLRIEIQCVCLWA